MAARTHYHHTYKSADADGFWMYLAARCTLNFESIPEWGLNGVGGQKLGDTGKVSAPGRGKHQRILLTLPNLQLVQETASSLAVPGLMWIYVLSRD